MSNPAAHVLARAAGILFVAIAYQRFVWWVVEPDGIEPTTSCLQSTRSTN